MRLPSSYFCIEISLYFILSNVLIEPAMKYIMGLLIILKEVQIYYIIKLANQI